MAASLAYSAKGDSGRASADHNEAIRLDPKLAGAAKEPQPKTSVDEQKDTGVFAAYSQTGSYRFLSLFGDVFERVRGDYVDKIDDWKLVEDSIKSMLTAPSLASSGLGEKKICADDLASRGDSSQSSYTYKALNCFGSVFEQAQKFRKDHSGNISDETLLVAAISGMLSRCRNTLMRKASAIC